MPRATNLLFVDPQFSCVDEGPRTLDGSQSVYKYLYDMMVDPKRHFPIPLDGVARRAFNLIFELPDAVCGAGGAVRSIRIFLNSGSPLFLSNPIAKSRMKTRDLTASLQGFDYQFCVRSDDRRLNALARIMLVHRTVIMHCCVARAFCGPNLHQLTLKAGEWSLDHHPFNLNAFIDITIAYPKLQTLCLQDIAIDQACFLLFLEGLPLEMNRIELLNVELRSGDWAYVLDALRAKTYMCSDAVRFERLCIRSNSPTGRIAQKWLDKAALYVIRDTDTNPAWTSEWRTDMY
ncbi:hypothetical protein QBC34DRAFT_374958 [Podospora aff. communis PSN243]|uniref:Uncharacterized protein n=1 Tax=Podospora aff. communis PSN243 TaxID=3040156 RepID=A0AAV9H6Q5_9PEZI|nr:hypothetical protein QBC34DRAFT_374958 [Podospora aff. communis PSN243]